MLSVLLADPALALDTTRAPRPDGRGRACAPTSAGPRISVSVPRLRGDSADVVTTAWAPLPRGHPAARALRFPATLAQRGGRWEIVARPGRGFRVLRLSKRDDG